MTSSLTVSRRDISSVYRSKLRFTYLTLSSLSSIRKSDRKRSSGSLALNLYEDRRDQGWSRCDIIRKFRRLGSKVRRSFARGTLADWTGWLPAREFASRSGAMNLEQVGPLDVHLLCRFGARFPPWSPPSPSPLAPALFPQFPLHLSLPKGTFAFTPSSSPLLPPPPFRRLPLLFPSFSCASHATLFLVSSSILIRSLHVHSSPYNVRLSVASRVRIHSIRAFVPLLCHFSLSLPPRRLFSKYSSWQRWKISSYHEYRRIV